MKQYLVTISTMQPMCYQYVVTCESAHIAEECGLDMWEHGKPSYDQWCDEDGRAEVVEVKEYTEVKR